MTTNSTFATTINCIDGRVHKPVRQWMQKQFKVDYLDRITVPGPDNILTTGSSATLADIRAQVEISVTKHGSKIVTIVGHYDCAGNPVDEDKHMQQIAASVAQVQSWNLPVQVIGLWVDSSWNAQPIENFAGERIVE